jgi:hypothetical protein
LGFHGIQAGALLTEDPGIVQWLTFRKATACGHCPPTPAWVK